MTPPQESLAYVSAYSDSARQKSVDDYYASPAFCEFCRKVIPLHDNKKPNAAKKKKFCDKSCAAKFNNPLKTPKRKAPTPKKCTECETDFVSRNKVQQFCSRSCKLQYQRKQPNWSHVRGKGFTSAEASRLRLAQLSWEENIASQMRIQGWEIFSPTVVCDRVGVKDGKVFFVEFKSKKSRKLRPGQKRICALVPDMYRIVVK